MMGSSADIKTISPSFTQYRGRIAGRVQPRPPFIRLQHHRTPVMIIGQHPGGWAGDDREALEVTGVRGRHLIPKTREPDQAAV